MSKRKFLTWREISHMMQAVSGGQTGARDCCLILLAFRHGLRISELLGLRFRDLDLQGGRIIVSRLKKGFSTVHPLMPDERRALEAWIRVRETWQKPILPEILFISTRGTPLSRQQAWRIVRNSGERSGLNTSTHPHMLRHACGYELAERGTDTRLIQDYLGHRNIRHTVRYTASNAARFTGLWDRENRLDSNFHGKKKRNK